MKDEECDEWKEKSNFRFLFSDLWSLLVILVFKSPLFSLNFHDNSKNKNWKIYFPFISVHCASSIKTISKLRGEGVYHG